MLHCGDMGAVTSLRHFPRLWQLKHAPTSLVSARLRSSNGSTARLDAVELKEKVQTLVKGIEYEHRKGCVNLSGKIKTFDVFLTGTLQEIRSLTPADHVGHVDQLLETGQRYTKQSPQEREALLITVKATMLRLVDTLAGAKPFAARRDRISRQALSVHLTSTYQREAAAAPTAPSAAHTAPLDVPVTATPHSDKVNGKVKGKVNGSAASAAISNSDDLLVEHVGEPVAFMSGYHVVQQQEGVAELTEPAAGGLTSHHDMAAVSGSVHRGLSDDVIPVPFDASPELQTVLPMWNASKYKLVFFDLETTGFVGSHIIELAAYAPATGSVLHSLINISPAHVPQEATAVNGITTAIVHDPGLPRFRDIAEDFVRLIEGVCTREGEVPLLVAHNGFGFDIPMLRKSLERVDMELPASCWALDTLRFSRDLYKRMAASSSGSSSPVAHKLQVLREHYAIPANSAHRAMDDVKIMAEVFAREYLMFQQHVEACDLDGMADEYVSVFVRSDEQLREKRAAKKAAVKKTSSSRAAAVPSLAPSQAPPSIPTPATQMQPSLLHLLEDGGAGDLQVPESSGNLLGLDDEQQLGSWGEADPADMLDTSWRDESDGIISDLDRQWAAAMSEGTGGASGSFLDTPLTRSVSGFSPTIRKLLLENGFSTLHDLLQYYPKGYKSHVAHKLEDGQNVVLVGVVSTSKVSRANDLNFWKCEVMVSSGDGEGEGEDQCVRVNKVMRGHKGFGAIRAFASKYNEGTLVTLKGKVHLNKKGVWEMDSLTEFLDNPVVDEGGVPSSQLSAVYSQCGTVKPQVFKKAIGQVLDSMASHVAEKGGDALACCDPVPPEVAHTLKLMSLLDAYKAMHQPGSMSNIEPARQRLALTELLLLQLSMLIKREVGRSPRDAVDANGVYVSQLSWMRAMQSVLPYPLTGAQQRVLQTILDDMQGMRPMLRLLQGDVGCGKTIVAFLSMMAVAGSGWQSALMAPTEVLAEQHFNNLNKLMDKMPQEARPRIELLTGSVKAKRKAELHAAIASGEVSIVIGTHALISSGVNYQALGLAVIDEQHRFGVEQRAKLQHRFHPAPHVLAMTATPIPRTLALVHHGDMGVTVIDEMPPGRAKTATQVLADNDANRNKVFRIIRDEVDRGNRCYIVYPLVEETCASEDVRAAEAEFERLRADGVLRGYTCGLLTGRMSAEQKYEALHKFAAGETPILVATSVVEVGVDVPEASVMVVEHAERFGLAQLHQLRGRVGRGGLESHCFLLSAKDDLSRLRVLEKTQDGLAIAEADLHHRGPGELFGKRQSGREAVQHLKTCKLPQDKLLVEAARRVAGQLIERYGLVPTNWPPSLIAALRHSKLPTLDAVPAKTIGLDT